MGIRPQAVQVVSPDSPGAVGRVFLREPLGLEDEVVIEMANGTRLRAVVPAGNELQEMTVVGLDFASRDVHLFRFDQGSALCHEVE